MQIAIKYKCHKWEYRSKKKTTLKLCEGSTLQLNTVLLVGQSKNWYNKPSVDMNVQLRLGKWFVHAWCTNVTPSRVLSAHSPVFDLW